MYWNFEIAEFKEQYKYNNINYEILDDTEIPIANSV